jgi:hypothetical protein
MFEADAGPALLNNGEYEGRLDRDDQTIPGMETVVWP